MTIRAVFFDLDDTLFDHQVASASGLAAVRLAHRSLDRFANEALEMTFFRLLEETHLEVLHGRISPDEGRVERFRRLFAWCGDADPATRAESAAPCYRAAYERARRPVPGATSLLQQLRGRVTIGIVTNNFVAEQREKLQRCGLDSLIDFLVTAEEIGEPKPGRAIFEAALRSAGCHPEEAIMVGDSWPVDVVGAVGAGIRAVWLNRRGVACPDPAQAIEIRSLEPAEDVAALLLQTVAGRRRS